MYNDILTIGNVTIHGYGLMIAIGACVALFIAEALAKKKGLDADIMYLFLPVCIIGGLLGAKLLFCIVEIKAFLHNPMAVLAGNGFVVYGGIIAGIASAVLLCKIKKLVFLQYFDVIMPGVAIAQGFGRIGCFLAGCCYGRETTSLIGIAFTNSNFAPNGVKLIPTQLFSAAGMFIIGIILIIYSKRKRKDGQVGSLYLILYSIGRFVIEFFRSDYRGEIGVFSTSQFISLFIFLIGVALYINYGNRGGQVVDAENDLQEDMPDDTEDVKEEISEEA